MKQEHAIVQVTLPEECKIVVDRIVREEGYATVSAYVAHLIDEDLQRRAAQESFESFIQKGIDSG